MNVNFIYLFVKFFRKYYFKAFDFYRTTSAYDLALQEETHSYCQLNFMTLLKRLVVVGKTVEKLRDV